MSTPPVPPPEEKSSYNWTQITHITVEVVLFGTLFYMMNKQNQNLQQQIDELKRTLPSGSNQRVTELEENLTALAQQVENMHQQIETLSRPQTYVPSFTVARNLSPIAKLSERKTSNKREILKSSNKREDAKNLISQIVNDNSDSEN